MYLMTYIIFCIPNDHEYDCVSVMPVVRPIYMRESGEFCAAVESVCHYLEQWTNCSINWTDQQLSRMPDSSNTIHVIFLCKSLAQALNNNSIVASNSPGYQKLHDVLLKIKGKEFMKIIVSFEDIFTELSFLNDTQHVYLIPDDQSFQSGLRNLIAFFSSSLKQGWYRNVQVSNMIDKIKRYVQFDNDINRLSDKNIPVPISTHIVNEPLAHLKKQSAKAGDSDSDFHVSRVKEWALNQSDLRQADDEEDIESISMYGAPSAVGVASVGQGLPDGVVMVTSGQGLSGRAPGSAHHLSQIPWVGPDSDDESEATTALEHRLHKINSLYTSNA